MDPRLNTGDWAQVFGEPVVASWDATHTYEPESDMRVEVCHGSTVSAAPFTREDVAEILYFHSNPDDHESGNLGDWDGCVVGRLKDGRYVACSGWCDYSGWG